MRRSADQHGLTLIELLVASAIMVVVSAMIILTWFSLQRSFAFTSDSDHQREAARDAVTRSAREMRDVKAPEGLVAIVAAEPNEFEFFTGFNVSDQSPSAQPVEVRYVYDARTHTIYRQRDGSDTGWSAEGEPQIVVLRNVVNDRTPAGSSTPLFSYVVYKDGEQVTVNRVDGPDMQSIVSVGIHVFCDLNPDKAPNYLELRTSAQLRNLRLR
jgi:prepilin-type N-terminal cleavage/methylation domain-containing protein